VWVADFALALRGKRWAGARFFPLYSGVSFLSNLTLVGYSGLNRRVFARCLRSCASQRSPAQDG